MTHAVVNIFRVVYTGSNGSSNGASKNFEIVEKNEIDNKNWVMKLHEEKRKQAADSVEKDKTVLEEMKEIIEEENEYNDVIEKDQEYEESTFIGKANLWAIQLMGHFRESKS